MGDFLTSDSPVGLTVSPLFAAAELADPGITILTESELYAASPRRSRVRRSAYAASNVEMLVRDVSELKVGDPVVHLEHGIGRYQGLEYKEMPDGPAEFLRIDYKTMLVYLSRLPTFTSSLAIQGAMWKMRPCTPWDAVTGKRHVKSQRTGTRYRS